MWGCDVVTGLYLRPRAQFGGLYTKMDRLPIRGSGILGSTGFSAWLHYFSSIFCAGIRGRSIDGKAKILDFFDCTNLRIGPTADA